MCHRSSLVLEILGCKTVVEVVECEGLPCVNLILVRLDKELVFEALQLGVWLLITA